MRISTNIIMPPQEQSWRPDQTQFSVPVKSQNNSLTYQPNPALLQGTELSMPVPNAKTTAGSSSWPGDIPPVINGEKQVNPLAVKNEAVAPVLRHYLSHPPANETVKITGFGDLSYGSISVNDANLVNTENDKEYIAGFIATPPEAGKLAEAHVNTSLLPEWQALVSEAATRNGGLGNSEDGFLAWSDKGFVRLRNPRQTPEQNRRMAAMSLQTGISVEKLPSKYTGFVASDAGYSQKIDQFLDTFDKEMAAFIKDPSDGIKLQEGRNVYVMEIDIESGIPYSQFYRKHGGVRGFVQKHYKYFQKIGGVLSSIGRYIPVYGWIAAAIGEGIKVGSKWIAAGKVKLQDAISFVGSMIGKYVPGLKT